MQIDPRDELRLGATRNPLSMFMKLGMNDLYTSGNKTYLVNIELTSGDSLYRIRIYRNRVYAK